MELEVARLIVFVAAATAPVTPKNDRRSKLRVSRRHENSAFSEPFVERVRVLRLIS
jgi:hypothetical protein